MALPLFKNEKKSKMFDLRIDDVVVNPHQPRKTFAPEGLSELSESIKQYGLIQPITVRKVENRYELIAGERRLRASRMAGLSTIPAMILEVTNCDSAALALIENLQRENLNYMDEAEAYSNLLVDFGLTQEELASRMGKTQATIANKLRILKLDPSVKKVLRENELTERHARALLKLKETQHQLKALEVVCSKSLNVKQTEDLIEDMLAPKKQSEQRRPQARLFHDVRIFVNTIKQAVDMMKQAGIEATSVKEETESYIEYTIKIPKA